MISFFPFIPQLPSAPFKIKSEVKRSFMAGFAASGIELITANNLMMYAKSRVQLNAPIDRQLVLETFRKGYRGIGVFWLQFGSGGGLSLATENKLRQIYREFHQPESMQANFAIRAVSAITVGALWNTPMENIALRCQLTSESFGSIVRRVVYPKIDEERFQLYRGLFPIVFRQATIMPFLLMGPELFTKLPKHVQSNDAAFPLLNFFIGGAGGVLSTPADTIRVYMQFCNQSFQQTSKTMQVSYFKGAGFRFFMVGYQSVVLNYVRPLFGIKSFDQLNTNCKIKNDDLT